MKPAFINDQWVQKDSLGMGQAGDTLAKICLSVQPPFTICVTGKWGSGKTSVLRRAFATLGGLPLSQALLLGDNKQELDKELLEEVNKLKFDRRGQELEWPTELSNIAQQSLCVWYSPWQHQNADNPIVPLLQEIRTQYQVRRKAKEDLLARTKRGAKKLLSKQGGLAALVLIEQVIDAAISLNRGKPVKMFAGTTDAVRKAWNDNNPENLVQPSDGQRFHLLFEEAIEQLLKDLDETERYDPKARLIIFIDDLDRCEEQTIVNLLEAIKLYFGTHCCVFVLGVDEAAVASALKRAWPGRSDDDNREYLEKLFQATLPVPQPKAANLTELITQQLQAHTFPEACIPDLVKHLQDLLEPNPRKIKNFLNSLCANWLMLRCPALENAENCQRLLMFQYLRNNHRPVWRLLEREPVLLQLLHRVINNSNEPLIFSQYSLDELRLTQEIFSRSFAHILSHQGEDLKLHLSQPLEQAVDKAIERMDRRRSDKCFAQWFINSIAPDESLDNLFLQINGD